MWTICLDLIPFALLAGADAWRQLSAGVQCEYGEYDAYREYDACATPIIEHQ